jgi:hypothetical protein
MGLSRWSIDIFRRIEMALSEKDKKQLAITGVLGGFLILLTIRAVIETKKHVKPRPSPPPPVVASVDPLPAPDIEQKDPQGDVTQQAASPSTPEKLEFRRDPFAKQIIIQSSGYFLSGIAWDDLNPKAIINNQVMEVGEKIHKGVIVKIEKDRVVIREGDDDRVFVLGE